MTEFREIAHRSPEYEQAVALRRAVLLDPFGIKLTEEEWAAESGFLHFGLFNRSDLLACCFVSPIDHDSGKLRQMAVVEQAQRCGHGRQLMEQVERDLEARGYDHIFMDAREPAVGFYDRLGYRITTDIFKLVGVSHYRMEKPLTSESEPAAIVLLGSPNEPDGALSSIARQRCERALVEHRRHPDWPILPTGGFGEHFNQAPKPHGFYTSQYLVARGVLSSRILPVAESSHTQDDADKAKPILEATDLKRLVLVTSDFHAARALRAFQSTLPDWRIHLSCSLSDLPPDELSRLREHEANALARWA